MAEKKESRLGSNEVSSEERFEVLRGKVLEVVEKPWGKYITYEESELGALKTLHVNPGARLSDQRHQKRSERWAIVQGEARVYLECEEDKRHVVDLKVGDAIEIPTRAWHRLENPSEKEELIVLERTFGKHDEQDIERREDDYGRVK